MCVQGPVRDELGDPSGPIEFSPSEAQREVVSGFYAEQWKAYQDAKRSKEEAAEEEVRRLQVRRLLKRSRLLPHRSASRSIWLRYHT